MSERIVSQLIANKDWDSIEKLLADDDSRELISQVLYQRSLDYPEILEVSATPEYFLILADSAPFSHEPYETIEVVSVLEKLGKSTSSIPKQFGITTRSSRLYVDELLEYQMKNDFSRKSARQCAGALFGHILIHRAEIETRCKSKSAPPLSFYISQGEQLYDRAGLPELAEHYLEWQRYLSDNIIFNQN